MLRWIFIFYLFFLGSKGFGQTVIRGILLSETGFATSGIVQIDITGEYCDTKSDGTYVLHSIHHGPCQILALASTGDTMIRTADFKGNDTFDIDFVFALYNSMNEVVVSGTLQPVLKSKSPVAVETFRSSFFRKNISSTLFESVGMINGIRPQLNCNICNTGDIHMNGMEGPYTQVLIDGMPIMSSLASVYGLAAIPSSLLEKVEVVRGPASSLYGSESMGGLINIITKSPGDGPKFSFESSYNSWAESNTDLSFQHKGMRLQTIAAVNYFHYGHARDQNADGFTDVALQNRISLFQRTSVKRESGKAFWVSIRYSYENRWGGEMRWNPTWRGSDSVYGESIYSNHAEVLGLYEFNTAKNIKLQYSFSHHDQNSVYGKATFLAKQSVAFAQLIHNRKIRNWGLLTGAGMRYTYYDDNTPATMLQGEGNSPSKTPLPGIFIQIESPMASKIQILSGYRLDYHPVHHFIHSPRVALKYNFNQRHFLRFQGGTGFRVVNLFTEEHAALSGDRKVVIAESLNPERSLSGNIQYTWIQNSNSFYMENEFTLFHTRFSNKIIGNYNTDPDAIIFSNLHGTAVSRGVSWNNTMRFSIPISTTVGLTYAEVYQLENAQKAWQWFAPRWSGNITFTYTYTPLRLTANITQTTNGPMRLPVQNNDFRPEYSPWYSLINIQITQLYSRKIEWYCGLKNLFNFIPQSPIMRPFDPFDKTAKDPIKNPNGYTFDTGYNYAPLQGRRIFAGIKYSF